MRKAFGLIFCLLLLTPGLSLAQGAKFMGTVTGEDGTPLPGVNVFIEELQRLGAGTATDAEGNYSFTVPASEVNGQEVTLVAQFIGYQSARRTITLSPGTHRQDLQLKRDVLNMEKVVVTGVAGATKAKKLPFTVNQIEGEDLRKAAPIGNPAAALQARVPGVQVVRGQGTPGEGLSIQIRGVTSITRGQSPLYIVDGVLMDGLVDLGALDVKSIEVVKGAAASSLYGSQAANGVVRITTKSGAGVQQGHTKVTVRNVVGFNQLDSPNQQSRYHGRMIARTSFVDPSGTKIQPGDWLRIGPEGNVYEATWNTASVDRSFNGVVFHDNPFPVFNDHLNAIFQRGLFFRNYISVGRRVQNANFYLSFGNVHNEGIVRGAAGYTRRNFRANIDYDVASDFTLSLRSYFSTSVRDDPTQMEGSTSIWPSVYFISPAVSLTERGKDGEFLVQPDQTTRYENPLYAVSNVDLAIKRQRVIASLQGEYRPLSWLNFEGEFSYTSYNGNREEFYNQGFETSRPRAVNGGYYGLRSGETRSWDASLSAMVTQAFGDLNTRTQVKVMGEQTEYRRFSVSGTGLATKGVPDIDNIPPDRRSSGSYQSDTRSLYAFVQTQLDFRGKYIGNFLVRRDGSSRFGEDERWHTYWRASGAYRISEEPWWPFENTITEFKPRYSIATAGTQPSFAAKFETYNVGGGRISKVVLGNPNLKPEHQLEQSIGLDFVLFDRVTGSFTYATSTVTNQLLKVPLPGYYGYNIQWQNAGTVESFTIEGQLKASVLQRDNLSLSAGVNFGRSISTIVEFNRSPFRTGRDDIFRIAEGVQFGTFFGNRYIRSKENLPEKWQPYADQFQINDEGWVVCVGQGNSWRDGIREQLWGTEVDLDGNGTADCDWGEPVLFQSENGRDVAIGNSTPAFTYGFNANLNWRGFNVYMLWGGQYGGDVYNFNRHWAGNHHLTTDQAGKSIETKKPASYLDAFGRFNNRYVEDGSYLKLRELSVGYTLDSETLADLFGPGAGELVDAVEISVTGRDLLTFTDYSGYDPEVGQGNAALLRIDYFTYPNYRTFSGMLKFTF